MFTIFRQKRNFVISRIDHLHHFVVVEDLLSGLKIEAHYGDKGTGNSRIYRRV